MKKAQVRHLQVNDTLQPAVGGVQAEPPLGCPAEQFAGLSSNFHQH
jgi:hypothetical protein